MTSRNDASGPACPRPSPVTPGADDRAVSPSRRTIGIGLVLLLLTGTLAIGHAIKAPCVHGDWSDGRPFTWLCHTDIIPALAVPVLHAWVDYPFRTLAVSVLAGLLLSTRGTKRQASF